MKKLVAWLAVVTCLVSLVLPVVAELNTTSAEGEVYASRYYMTGLWGDFEKMQIWGQTVFGRGEMRNGELSAPAITDPADDRNAGNYMYGDAMVFTFDQPTVVSSMTFESIMRDQFPTEYEITYRAANYYSEAHGFTGNPSEAEISYGMNWPITEGFAPTGGLPYTEVFRDETTVTIDLSTEVECVAIMIEATTKGSTPWSCKEAHFYGWQEEPEVSVPTPTPTNPPPFTPNTPVEREVYASQYYMNYMWGNFTTWSIWELGVFGQGSLNQGVLSPSVITSPEDDRNNGNYMVTDMLVFTFDEPIVVSSMTFQSISDGEFPIDYQIQYRDANYYSEEYGFTGNPSADHIAAGENWPITAGFGPEGGLPYTEVSRDGDTVTINLDLEIECVAIMIQATTKGSTPWSCEEAHFYGWEADTGSGSTTTTNTNSTTTTTTTTPPIAETPRYTYEIQGGGAIITGCTPTLSGNVTLPSTLGGYSVTGIGERAFIFSHGLTSVTIPNSVTAIGSAAFAYCTGLTDIVLPSGLTEIGESAFADCVGLTSITILSGVTDIGNLAFSGSAALTIYGYTGSAAETYAAKQNISFQSIGDVRSGEEYASWYYMTAPWGNFDLMQIWGLSVFGQGAMSNGVLARPVITNPADIRNAGNYMATDAMVFTFDRPTTVSSMTFKSVSNGEFPTDYQITYRTADYYSEKLGFTGNPSARDIAAGENWPIIEGFVPENGLPYTEVSRKGDTVTIKLERPVKCVAIMIEATDKGSTPWSCKEAHFYSSDAPEETPAVTTTTTTTTKKPTTTTTTTKPTTTTTTTTTKPTTTATTTTTTKSTITTTTAKPSSATTTTTTTIAPEKPAQAVGDVSGDDKINAVDATRVLLSVVGKVTLNEPQTASADVNGDGKVGAVDATFILLHTVGKRLIES